MFEPSRLLRVFGDIRREEIVTALLMTGTLFLLMAGYYVLKTVREPLILMSGTGRLSGAELRSYSGAMQALVLMVLVPLYGRVAARVPTVKLVIGVTVFFVVNIQLFALWAWLDLPGIGVAFYIWLGIFNLAVIAQFWSFANDLYRLESGARLFPIIAIGAAAGSPVGAFITGLLIRDGVDVYRLMQVTAVTLVLCAILIHAIHRRETVSRPAGASTERPLQLRGGFRLIARSGYLRLVVVMIILLSVVTRNGEYMLSRTVLEAAQEQVVERSEAAIAADGVHATMGRLGGGRADTLPSSPVDAAADRSGGLAGAMPVSRATEAVADVVRDAVSAADETLAREIVRDRTRRFIGGFYGDFYFWVNLLTLLVQGLLVSRLLRVGGMAAVVLLLPVVSLGVYAIFALGAGFAMIRWAKTAEKVVDYSVMNTARALLWLPTTREEKYNAKLAVDTFFVRFGGVLTALCVFVAGDLLAWSIPAFAAANVVLALIWLWFAFRVVRENRRLQDSVPEVAQSGRDAVH
ncbi:MAG: translocase [Deltaproteobacteria bacterium]|nr:MAG: translocase [Deltaproteobacteria bacterium]